MNYIEELVNLEEGLIFVTGKGGVGKTTFSALLSYLRTLKGRDTYLISADPFHSFADAFGLREAFEEDPIIPNNKKKLGGSELNAELINKLEDELKEASNERKEELNQSIKFLKKGGKLIIKQLEPTGNKALRIKDKIIKGIYTEYELLAGKEIINGFNGLMIIDTDCLEGLQRIISYANDNEELMSALKGCKIVPVTTTESMSLEKLNNFLAQPMIKGFSRLERLVINNVNNQSWVDFADLFPELKNVKRIMLYEKDFEPTGFSLLSLLKPDMTVKPKLVVQLDSNTLPDKKVMMFCGKGGQGKTTMSCAYALKQAMNGKTVYLMSADAISSLADSFNIHIPSYKGENPWFNLGSTRAYAGLPIMIYKQDAYLDSIPGVPFYCVMAELMKGKECLVIDAPPSGNIRKSLELGRKDDDYMQELLFKLDLMQLRLRKKHSRKSELLLEFLKNRRSAFEQGARVMRSEDFLAVPVLRPTITALNETLSLESMLSYYEISPYTLPQTNYCRVIINRAADKEYNQGVIKRMKEVCFPEETHKLIIVPQFNEEIKGREMLEKLAGYL